MLNLSVKLFKFKSLIIGMKIFIPLLCSLIFFKSTHAQNLNDSLTSDITNTSQRISADTITVSIMSKLQQVSVEVNMLSQNLSKRLNTVLITEELSDIELKTAFSEQYINGTDKHFSYRLLKVHSIFLAQLKDRMSKYSEELSKYNKQVAQVEKQISTFVKDTSYKIIPVDSTMRSIYLSEYDTILKRWIRLDSINKFNQASIANLQSKLTNDYIRVTGLYENVLLRMEHFNEDILKATDLPLLKARRSDYSKSIFNITGDSAAAGSKIMLYYLSSHLLPVIITTIICYLFVFWIIYLRKDYKKHLVGYIRTSKIKLKYLLANPFFGSLLLTFSFAPFFFPNPPVIFVELIWTFLGLTLTVLFFKDKSLPFTVKVIWSAFFIVFRVVAILNLFLYSSFEERWLLLVINLICLSLDYFILAANKKRKIFHNIRTSWVIYISAFLHVIALVSNFVGLFNLAKIITAAATFSVFTAAVLRVFVDTGKEALTFQLAMLKRTLPMAHEKDLRRIYFGISRLLEAFAVIAWILIFLINLNIFEYVKAQLLTFLGAPVNIGSTSFTIGSVVLFIVIILVSGWLSRLVSLITDITVSRNNKYQFLSNTKLLVKLFIITSGVLLAFMISGIPIDKLAIVLGALGVGIGFGLQNLVSNLVAGLMITMERPIRIGDRIEVGVHSGIIKEIGVRSIQIYTPNGSYVMIPNNDLLSQHVVNWTLNNAHSRIEIQLIVDALNDLHQTKQTLVNLLKEHTLILQNPEPLVLIKDMANGGIEFTCYFWCENISQNMLIKSKVLENIYDEFQKLSITIRDNNININQVMKP